MVTNFGLYKLHRSNDKEIALCMMGRVVMGELIYVVTWMMVIYHIMYGDCIRSAVRWAVRRWWLQGAGGWLCAGELGPLCEVEKAGGVRPARGRGGAGGRQLGWIPDLGRPVVASWH